MNKITTIATLLVLASLAAPSVQAFEGFPAPDAGSTFTLMALSLCGVGFIRHLFGRAK